jgi:hypothetical protein
MTDRISTKHVIDHFISTIVGKIEDIGGEDHRGLTDKEKGLLDDADIFHSITHAHTPESIQHEMLFARMKSRKKRQYDVDNLEIWIKYLIPLSVVIFMAIFTYLVLF